MRSGRLLKPVYRRWVSVLRNRLPGQILSISPVRTPGGDSIMTRSHTSAPANASARPAGRGRSPFVAAQVLAGPRHARTRQAMLVGMAVAMLAAAGGVHAAESEAVPVSIEGKTFKVEAPVQTQVVTDGVARRVEAGTTANGAPVIVTRLSSRKKVPSADKAEENGQAQASKAVAGQAAQEAAASGQDAGGAADTEGIPVVPRLRQLALMLPRPGLKTRKPALMVPMAQVTLQMQASPIKRRSSRKWFTPGQRTWSRS